MEKQPESQVLRSGEVDIGKFIKLSKKAKERRKKAPSMGTPERNVIQQKELLRTQAPDCVGRTVADPSVPGGRRVIHPENHAIFIEQKDWRLYANRGYEPCMYEGDPIIETNGGDIAVKCPYSEYEARLAADSAISDRQVGEASDVVANSGGAVTEEIGKIASDDPRADQLLADPDIPLEE